PRLSRGRNGRENSFAYFPEFLLRLGIRLQIPEASNRGLSLLFRLEMTFHQERGTLSMNSHGLERSLVHQLDRTRAAGFELRDFRASALDRIEVAERGRFVARLRDRSQNGLGDESERSFRTDHEMRENLLGRIEVDERVERVARRVFDRVLPADPLEERGVC